MAWMFKNGDLYEGDTHELGSNTYSGKTRTYESRILIKVEGAVAAKPKKPRKARATPFKKEE